MPTATQRKPKSALSALEEHEARWAEAAEAATALSREHLQEFNQARELHDRRQRLVHHEPGLVTHTGEPMDPDGEIAEIDKAIAGIGDLDEMRAKAEHAKRLEARVKQDVDRYIAEHFGEIVEGLRPDAEAVVAREHEQARLHAEAVDAVLAFHQRSSGLAHVAGIDTRTIPGLDEVADLQRTLNAHVGVGGLSVPLPELNR